MPLWSVRVVEVHHAEYLVEAQHEDQAQERAELQDYLERSEGLSWEVVDAQKPSKVELED